MGLHLYRGPFGELGGDSFAMNFERWLKGVLVMECLYPWGLCERNLEGSSLPGTQKDIYKSLWGGYLST
jgi:hypothetical protein